MKKLFIFLLLLIIALILQTILVGSLALRRGKPDFFLILLIFWAWDHGWREGLLAGFFIGILQDVLFFPLLGLSAFSLSLVGFLSGEVKARVYEENIIFFLVVVGLASILNGALLSLWLIIFQLSSSFLRKAAFFIFPAFLYNSLLAFFVFILKTRLGGPFRKGGKPSSFL